MSTANPKCGTRLLFTVTCDSVSAFSLFAASFTKTLGAAWELDAKVTPAPILTFLWARQLIALVTIAAPQFVVQMFKVKPVVKELRFSST